MHLRLVIYSNLQSLLHNPNKSIKPKTKAINLRHTSKCTAHIRSRKIFSIIKQVTVGYCCQQLLCILGNHVYLQQVGGLKRKPQIYGTYKVRHLCIQGVENGSYFSPHYHQLYFISQPLVSIFLSTRLWSCKLKFVHVYLQLSSLGLVTYVIQVCHNIHVDLLSSPCLFVAYVIQICHDIQFAIIFRCICHQCHSDLPTYSYIFGERC